jgi:hypothetical protein
MLNNPHLKAVKFDAAASLAEAAGLNPALRTAGELSGLGTIYNPYKARVHISPGGQFLTGGTVTVTFDTIDFDSAGGYSATSFQYKIPQRGYYFVYGKLTVALPVGTLSAVLRVTLLVNGAVWQGSTYSYVPGGFATSADGTLQNDNYELVAADLKLFQQGDLISVQVFESLNPVANPVIQGGNVTADSSYLTIHMISS